MKNLIIVFALVLLASSFDSFGEVKKVSVVSLVSDRKYSATFGIDPSLPIGAMQPWINKLVAKTARCIGWGCSARDVPKIAGTYNPILVTSEYQKDGATWVKLKADYEITITDITAQHEARQADKAARKTEIGQIKQAIALIDASSKPAWEKKLLKRLVLELRE